MASLDVRAAMGADPALHPRIAAAVIRLALEVLSAPVLGEEAPIAQRTAAATRRTYALNVTTDVPSYTTRAQWGLACWDQSDLADSYAEGGADAVTDEQITSTLAAIWAATGGG